MKEALDEIDLDDLISRSPQGLADQLLMPVVWCDHQVTRRQRLHGVCLPSHENGFSSTHLAEVLEWVHERGFTDAILVTSTPRQTHHSCYITFETLDGQNRATRKSKKPPSRSEA